MRVPCLVAVAATGLLAHETATAGMVFQGFHQAETRDAYGRVTREAANIYPFVCNGNGETGLTYYIYQYLRRPGFRVIVPPFWGSAIGGRDWPTWAQAVSVASCAQRLEAPYYGSQPVPIPPQLPPYWPQPAPNPQQVPQAQPQPMPPPAPAPAPQPAGPSLTGKWSGPAGTYDIVQMGSSFTWRVGNEMGMGTISGNTLQRVTWGPYPTGTGWGGPLDGTIETRPSDGLPITLRFQNGVALGRILP